MLPCKLNKRQRTTVDAPLNMFACHAVTAEAVSQLEAALQRFLSPHRLATKSVDGRMNVWDLGERKHISTWKVSSA